MDIQGRPILTIEFQTFRDHFLAGQNEAHHLGIFGFDPDVRCCKRRGPRGAGWVEVKWQERDPMADPWDERYIYLHENHINQPNVGLNIPGPYILWVCLLILISALLFSCVFVVPWFFSMACWWTWTFKYRVAIAADQLGGISGLFLTGSKTTSRSLGKFKKLVGFLMTWAEYLPLKCRYVMFFLGGFCIMFWTDSKEFSENFSLVYVWIYSLPRMQSSPPGCHYILSRESL